MPDRPASTPEPARGAPSCREAFQALREAVAATVVGQHALLERLLVAVLADGHLLVEGVPGLAKTTAVRALADALGLGFRRIQFTPDMIPGDITGSEILQPAEGRFRFVPGPVFHELVLADEINRAPPKVQSALLEAMEERQVTVAGHTRALPEPFLVMATQNPLEQEGTYPLPEAQLDRFLMKVELGYPSQEEELEILRRHTRSWRGEPPSRSPAVSPGADGVLAARREVAAVYLDPMLERYIVALVHATRDPGPWDPEAARWLERGASPRACLALARAARARAWLEGRDHVEPDDLLALAPDVLRHRLRLGFAAQAEGITPGQAVDRLLEAVPVP